MLAEHWQQVCTAHMEYQRHVETIQIVRHTMPQDILQSAVLVRGMPYYRGTRRIKFVHITHDTLYFLGTILYSHQTPTSAYRHQRTVHLRQIPIKKASTHARNLYKLMNSSLACHDENL